MGKADVISKLSDEHHLAGRVPIHSEASVVEMVALFTGSASIPELYKQLESFRDDETLEQERMFTLRALRRVPAPTHVDVLLKAMEGSNSAIRREAARAMELNGGKDAEVTETWEQLAAGRTPKEPASPPR